MGTMTFSVDAEVMSYIEAQVGEDFPDAAAVVSELVRRDKERRIAELRSRIEESAASGLSARTLAERIEEGDRLLNTRNVGG